MAELEDKFVVKMSTEFGLFPECRPTGSGPTTDHLSIEEIGGLLQLFNLLAAWDQKGKRDERRNEN
jgi:hypothetical protein